MVVSLSLSMKVCACCCREALLDDRMPGFHAAGASVVINLQRRVLLHRFNFKDKVRAVAFSPDDTHIAVGVGRKLQIWRAPGLKREFSPFVLHHTHTGHFDDITTVAWSPNGRYGVLLVVNLPSCVTVVSATDTSHRAPRT